MPDSEFESARSAVQEGQREAEENRLALFLAKEKLKEIGAQRTRLKRHFNEANEAYKTERDRLEDQQTATLALISQGEIAKAELIGRVSDRLRDFKRFTDPRQGLSNLSDEYPILLLPVRLETRFKEVTGDEGVRHELWVRVYPDDIALDSFEPVLSDSEIAGARDYWSDIWRSGGDDGEDRAAWRGLVASHGAGRAGWIQTHYQPLNLDQKPSRVAESDIILVVATETPLEGDALTSAETYWQAVWLADGDPAAETAAQVRLQTDLGEARAADITAQYAPYNLTDKPTPPLSKADVRVSLAQVVWPKTDDLATKRLSWTQAARVNVMPDRFVLLGFVEQEVEREVDGQIVEEKVLTKVREELGIPIPVPLIAGPDPSAAAANQLKQKDDELSVGEDLRWMFDFEQAEKVGMGFKVELTPEEYERGFDRLIVAGVRISADEGASQVLLETLIHNHQHSRTGFGLVPQGTPTNNTEAGSAGYSEEEDSDDSYEDTFLSNALFQPSDAWLERKDGQWLAESLGIDSAVLAKVAQSGGTDQCEARAMNTALWPATAGYFMDTMMAPIFQDSTIEQTRWFFTHFVSGRGIVPAIRVGNQPYGILPTTAFSRMAWFSDKLDPFSALDHPADFATFLEQLHGLLTKLDKQQQWAELVERVAHLDKPGDAHQVLLDILGLHSGSVEYHQRYAETVEDLYNRLNILGLGAQMFAAWTAQLYRLFGMQLLADLGYSGSDPPEILERVFLQEPNRLNGSLVDDRPLSETEQIRAYTAAPDEKNYIEWLIESARTSLDALRREQGFADDKKPLALLYLLLRHALILGYWDASIRLYQSSEVLTGNDLRTARLDPKFIHISSDPDAVESRWQYLYKAEPRITDDNTLTVGDFIPQILSDRHETRFLDQQLAALEHLKNAPTARLERAFAEHVDCVSYRMDAWKLGLVNYQLASMRYKGETGVPKKGLYLGMYGWLENLRPQGRDLTPVELDPDRDTVFNKPEDPPLMRDSSNAGYVSAPSLNHAVTAAVLRGGYLANAAPGNESALAVNLSSARVRQALGILEGMRNGQSLGALLGYRFERSLHDGHGLAEVDAFIYKLRRVFPLVADSFSATSTGDEDIAIEALEARNVMDGLKLVEHVTETGNRVYPFGKVLPTASAEEAAAINAEVDRLLDQHDAVADLAIAESVHQMAQGNQDRTAANLDAQSKASFSLEPDIAQTPRSGITLQHRVALHLETGLDPEDSPIPGLEMTPRAKAEPTINKWLAGVLPGAEQVVCKVSYKDADGGAQDKTISQKQLGLQPIDLLYVLTPETSQAMNALDDLVVRHVTHNEQPAPGPDKAIEIRYTERSEDKIPLFEVAAQIKSLRALILQSRPLRASDSAMVSEASEAGDAAVSLDKQRITLIRDPLAAATSDLRTFQNDLARQLADLPANEATIIDEIDNRISEFTDTLAKIAACGIPQSGFGFAYQRKADLFGRVFKVVADKVERWQERLVQIDALMAEYAALPDDVNDREKFVLLHRAEGRISTRLTSPLPSTPAEFERDLSEKHGDFIKKKQDLEEVSQSGGASLAALLSAVVELGEADPPLSDFDFVALDISAVEKSVINLAQELASKAGHLADDLDHRLTEVDELLTAFDAGLDASLKVTALLEAGQILLGEEFKMLPEFSLSPEQADEWHNAWSGRSDLLNYLKDSDQGKAIEFPVDDWLYGVARVREKMRHWENLVLVTGAFERAEPELQPLQFPAKAGDHWLGLAYPENYEIDGDRLLYTAHHAVAFERSNPHCGLLLDDWSEKIPAKNETLGLTFHYDRPNAEPPQSLLLVTPPDFSGRWLWQDLVDAIGETLDLAKQRGIEPEHIDSTSFAQFLPATLHAVTYYPVTIALNLALNNGLFEHLGEAGDD